MEIIWPPVSRRPLIKESLVQCQHSLCEICATQSGTGINFSHSSSVSPTSITPPIFCANTFLDYRAVQPYKLPASLNIIIIRHQLGFDRQVSASSDSPLLKGLSSRLRPLRLERIKYYFQNSKSLNNATKIRRTHLRSMGSMNGKADGIHSYHCASQGQ